MVKDVKFIVKDTIEDIIKATLKDPTRKWKVKSREVQNSCYSYYHQRTNSQTILLVPKKEKKIKRKNGQKRNPNGH